MEANSRGGNRVRARFLQEMGMQNEVGCGLRSKTRVERESVHELDRTEAVAADDAGFVTGGAVVLAAEISDVLSHPMSSKDLGDNILRKEEVDAIGRPTS